jgi:hypothetical protein
MALKDEQPRVTESHLSLIPLISRTKKNELKTRIQTEKCYLPLKECDTQHIHGCWKAFIDARGFCYKSLKVADPRSTGPRFCTADEAYWRLMHDPRSPFSKNYGKSGFPSFETSVLRFIEHAKKNGYFLDPPRTKRGILDKKFNTEDYAHIVFDENKPFELQVKNLPKTEKQDTEEPIPVPEEPIPKPSPDKADTIYRDPTIIAARHGAAKSTFSTSGKSVKMTEVIKWVFDNMPLKDCDLDSCPSPSAFGLLQWARSEPDKFYTQFVIKLIPSQRELDNAAKLADDGEKALPLLENFIREQN